MPKLSERERKEIYKIIPEALSYYRLWRAGGDVPELCEPYLELLDPHISSYLGALDRIEEECVDYFLSGWTIDRVAKLNYFVKAHVNRYTVRKWVFGTKEYDGLVNTMMQICLPILENYCVFCHRDKFGTDSGFHPKLSGTVCPHREMEAQAKEAAR